MEDIFDMKSNRSQWKKRRSSTQPSKKSAVKEKIQLTLKSPTKLGPPLAASTARKRSRSKSGTIEGLTASPKAKRSPSKKIASTQPIVSRIPESPISGPSRAPAAPVRQDCEESKETPAHKSIESITAINFPDNDESPERGSSQTVFERVRTPQRISNCESSQGKSLTPGASGSDPFTVSAQFDSKLLEVDVKLKPNAQVEKIHLEMNVKAPADHPVRVIGNFQKHELQKKQWSEIFKRSPKKNSPSVQSVDQGVDRVHKNAYITPYNGSSSNMPARACPFYKKIPNTSFVVDAFNYGSIPGITKYFLSHFHYDHYQGLTKRWQHPILCSEITARLVHLKIKVAQDQLRPMPMDTPVVVDQVEVTLLEANHCPGAVMFLFKLTDGTCILHCGDFRAGPQMESYPSFWSYRINQVFLDTTYCNEEYDFPPQSEAIAATLKEVQCFLQRRPRGLIAVGTYTIGKERIFLAIAERFDLKIWAPAEKTRILKLLQERVLEERLVTAMPMAQVHVLNMFVVKNRMKLQAHLDSLNGKYDHILGITPTGWTHASGHGTSGKGLKIRPAGPSVSLMDVPYSEHSSFSELKRFVQFLNLPSAKCIIPTVNVGNPKARTEMNAYFNDWINCSDKAKRRKITTFFNTD